MTDQYVPGSCNIGPAEIALRRRAGHAGLVVTAALGAALLRSDLPRAWRLTLAVPAAGAASGYLQAHERFCADFGWRGVYNFDRRGQEQPVAGDQRPGPGPPEGHADRGRVGRHRRRRGPGGDVTVAGLAGAAGRGRGAAGSGSAGAGRVA